MLLVQAQQPGTYWIAIGVPRQDGDAGEVDEPNLGGPIFRLVVGGGDDDDPDDPPLPGKKWQVVIVHESDRLDNLPPDQQSLIKGLAFRERLKAAGHTIPVGGVIDIGAPNPQGGVPEAQAAFLSACKGKTLPRLCLGPLEGGTIRTFPLPENEPAVFALLGGKP